MDAFYASVEQRDFPEYRGKPLAVGGSRERGVVAAASYEARKFGVRSAMPSATARRKCPHLIFAKARFDVYREVSHQIREVFFEFTDLVEPLSLDEAYLDVTENKPGFKSAIHIARLIKDEIKARTRLTASAGVSFNKFLAKTASDLDKPDGLSVILPDQALGFLEKLEIGKFYGIGKKTTERMHRMGIFNGADLKKLNEEALVASFGKAGRYYYRIVRARDERPVTPDRIRKSLGAERTFMEDLDLPAEMYHKLDEIAEKVSLRLAAARAKGRTITLKIKHSDFTLQTRSRTTGQWLYRKDELYRLACQLLHQPHLPEKPVRLLGISLSSLNTDEAEKERPQQLSIPFPRYRSR